MAEAGNAKMVECLVGIGYADARVADAMLAADRAQFVPERYAGEAYADHPLPIGSGQTISAPSIVAVMAKELDVKKGMKVLEVGAGSGYQAAVLAHLAGESGRVFTVERLPEMAELARKNLASAGVRNAEVVCADGTKGWERDAPYDRIIVAAASPDVPAPLFFQLKEGGKMIIPIGTTYWQDLVLLEKRGKEIVRKSLLPVLFVPLIGEHGFAEKV